LALVDEDGEERLALVNVGDSRAYLLQQGELEQLTEDHSLVAQLVRDGQLTPEEATVHPQRSIITRALGLDPDVEVDSWELTPYRGDRLLLCRAGSTGAHRASRGARQALHVAGRDLPGRPGAGGGPRRRRHRLVRAPHLLRRSLRRQRGHLQGQARRAPVVRPDPRPQDDPAHP